MSIQVKNFSKSKEGNGQKIFFVDNNFYRWLDKKLFNFCLEIKNNEPQMKQKLCHVVKYITNDFW